MNSVSSAMGFREIEHTADWELEVWAPDLVHLFKQAAQGMYTLAGIHLHTSPRLERSISIEAIDGETLLVNFLSELLYLSESEAIAFDNYQMIIKDWHLTGLIFGAPIAERQKDIKAVTFHNLEIRAFENGLITQIVFDV